MRTRVRKNEERKQEQRVCKPNQEGNKVHNRKVSAMSCNMSAPQNEGRREMKRVHNEAKISVGKRD